VSEEGEGGEHKEQEMKEEGAESQHTMTSEVYLYFGRNCGWEGGGRGMKRD